jgi:predicted enzyme related to lactoylglutathione lyase
MSIRGRFVWEELMTTDVASAISFYNKIAGLKAGKADPGYTHLEGSNGQMGGVMPLPDEAKKGGTPPCWVSYVGVENTDQAARMLTTLGGKVHKAPWDIADGGRIAIVADPQGAMFALYSNPKAAAPPPPPKPGHASWHELATSDHVAAFSFYQNLFGWHVVNDMDMGPAMGIYRLFAAQGMTEAFGGMYTKPAQQPGPPAWLPYIKVADAKAATARAKSLGAQIMHGPAEVPGGGWIMMGADPQGVMFALHQTPGKATSPKRAAKAGAKAGVKKNAAAKRKTAPKKKSATKKKVAKKRKAGAKK